MSSQEIDLLLSEYQFLLGLELQQIRLNEKALHLQFYGGGHGHWLTFSYKPGNPYFFVSQTKGSSFKGLKKPLSLFCRTHFTGRTLLSFKRNHALGRVADLELSGGADLQLWLIPGRVNVVARLDKKQVSLNRMADSLAPHSEAQLPSLSTVRPPSFFENVWDMKKPVDSGKETSSVAKALKKKRSGLAKMEEKRLSLLKSDWAELGQFLKQTGSMEGVPEELQHRLSRDESLSWNIENCFAQQKKNQLKVQGTLYRIEELKVEIKKLESGALLPSSPSTPSLLHQTKAKGRTLTFAGSKLYIGRSGPDNLKLLRQAKPWYIWLHVKDYPGAHGILEQQKGSKAPPMDATLAQAAKAVVEQSIPKGHSGRFEVTYTECRYVRPIKGAKPGQVTYSREKVITVEV